MRKDGLCHKCKKHPARSGGYCNRCSNHIANQFYHLTKKKWPAIESIEGEVWLPVKGFESSYSISNMGRLKRLSGQIKRAGWYDLNLQEKLINPSKDRKGYLLTFLTQNRNRTKVYIHRLVAIHFVPNPHNKPDVNHKQGVKDDNRYTELEWVTHSENMKHSSVHGFHRFGERHPKSVLSESQVVEIFNSKESERSLAKKYNCSRATINCIKSGRSWKYLNLKN